MPRRPRIINPGVPIHITQRGVDRCATFKDDTDRATYLWLLRVAAERSRCAIHAYVLMSNHVHLLLTPADVGSPPLLMHFLGGPYVRYFNDRHRRTGPLWEGRYRSKDVANGRYFFTCSRYIEQNPVRAGLADNCAAYEWSSFHRNANGALDAVITPHSLYTALGADERARCGAYRSLHQEVVDSKAAAEIRTAPLERGRRQADDSRRSSAPPRPQDAMAPL